MKSLDEIVEDIKRNNPLLSEEEIRELLVKELNIVLNLNN